MAAMSIFATMVRSKLSLFSLLVIVISIFFIASIINSSSALVNNDAALLVSFYPFQQKMFVFVLVCIVLATFTNALFAVNYAHIKNKLRIKSNKLELLLKQMSENESHLQAVFDGSYDGIISIDSDGKIDEFSLGAVKIFGYESKDIVGKNINTIILDEEKDEHDQYIKKASLKGKKLIRRPRQLYGKHKSGHAIPVEVSLNKYEKCGQQKYVGVVRDVSDLSIERNNLVSALEKAELASEAKNRLLSSASHELRTPLNAITGFSEILLKDNDLLSSQDRLEHLKDIYESAGLLLRLVNDVLDYAKLDSDNLDLNLEKIHLKEVLQYCLRINSVAIEKKCLKLTLQCSDSLWVIADENRLKQVFLNVVSNAIKYNHKSGSIDIVADVADPGFVSVEVADSGVGINPSKAPLLFEPFSRLHDLSLNIDGSGIGLALSKNIIIKMGGDIFYRSNGSSGSVFSIVIPATTSEKIQDVSPEKVDCFLNGDLQILYVEDNPVNVRLMEKMLARINIGVDSVTSAEAAYSYLADKVPGVILMDINLPGDSGLVAAKKIHAMPGFLDIPILAVSASVDDIKRCTVDFVDVIAKPFNSEDLYQKLIRCAENS